MIVINMKHGMNDAQRRNLARLLAIPVQDIDERVLVPTFDLVGELVPQVLALVDGLITTETLLEEIALIAPSVAEAALIVAVYVHGKLGYWPPILRMAQTQGLPTPRWDVVEVVRLGLVGQTVRVQRTGGGA